MNQISFWFNAWLQTSHDLVEKKRWEENNDSISTSIDDKDMIAHAFQGCSFEQSVQSSFSLHSMAQVPQKAENPCNNTLNWRLIRNNTKYAQECSKTHDYCKLEIY